MRPFLGICLGLICLGLAVGYLPVPAHSQDQAVPQKAQGVWAKNGKCSDPASRLVIRERTVQFGANPSDKVAFFPNDSRSGNSAIHWSEEGVVSNLEYIENEDAFIFHPEGYGMGTPVRYKRCSHAAKTAERRCGWYVNPTPRNLYLVDRDATWWITSQGQAMGPDAAGIDNAPAFDDKQFVATQGGHGYGCACMTVETNAKERRITKVIAGEILPLARCKGDTSLPNPY